MTQTRGEEMKGEERRGGKINIVGGEGEGKIYVKKTTQKQENENDIGDDI